MDERRIDHRLLCAELVELTWEDGSGRKRQRVANLEDISLSGICLQVEKEIPAGTAITMSFGDGKLVGVVRYCVFRDIGYFLGIQLEEGCRWSTQHFKPQHLLDPLELVERAMLRHQGDAEEKLLNEPAPTK